MCLRLHFFSSNMTFVLAWSCRQLPHCYKIMGAKCNMHALFTSPAVLHCSSWAYHILMFYQSVKCNQSCRLHSKWSLSESVNAHLVWQLGIFSKHFVAMITAVCVTETMEEGNSSMLQCLLKWHFSLHSTLCKRTVGQFHSDWHYRIFKLVLIIRSALISNQLHQTQLHNTNLKL